MAYRDKKHTVKGEKDYILMSISNGVSIKKIAKELGRTPRAIKAYDYKAIASGYKFNQNRAIEFITAFKKEECGGSSIGDFIMEMRSQGLRGHLDTGKHHHCPSCGYKIILKVF